MTATAAPVRPVPVETVTPIKPSEAIRLGCLIAPVQLFKDGYENERRHAACAFGAMALGYGSGWRLAFAEANSLHGSGRFFIEGCPEGCGERFGDPVHLNDNHRWSRERIADWLAEKGL